MKKRYLTLASLLLATSTYATPRLMFGAVPEDTLAANHPITVNGPLVQVQTAGGTLLSFQQGATFALNPNGTITLLSGNMRIGPSGGDELHLTLPNGNATVAPLSALTITTNGTTTTGRIYQGSLEAEGRSFTTGQGFALTSEGAQATFQPAPARSPQPPVTTLAAAAIPAAQPSAEEQPAPTPAPQPKTTPAPEPTPETPANPTPQPEPEVEPEPETLPEVIAETPTTEQPQAPAPILLTSTLTRTSIAAAFAGESTRPALATEGLTLTQDLYDNDQQTPNTLQGGKGAQAATLLRGSAVVEESFSHGPLSGLARWVGGDLTRLDSTNTAQTYANSSLVEETPSPHSLHLVWGETATNLPTTGTFSYSLLATTAPTYIGSTAGTESGTFTGDLSITFGRGYGGRVATYNLQGAVTMPQAEGATVYTLATNSQANPLSATPFANSAALTVTAPEGATACPTGSCTGAASVALFGSGGADAGVAYTVNATGPTGLAGAALFTRQP